jgi:hypothetical protein
MKCSKLIVSPITTTKSYFVLSKKSAQLVENYNFFRRVFLSARGLL